MPGLNSLEEAWWSSSHRTEAIVFVRLSRSPLSEKSEESVPELFPPEARFACVASWACVPLWRPFVRQWPRHGTCSLCTSAWPG